MLIRNAAALLPAKACTGSWSIQGKTIRQPCAVTLGHPHSPQGHVNVLPPRATTSQEADPSPQPAEELLQLCTTTETRGDLKRHALKYSQRARGKPSRMQKTRQQYEHKHLAGQQDAGPVLWTSPSLTCTQLQTGQG